MKYLLLTYEMASGQSINFMKSGIFFSHNVSSNLKGAISNILGASLSLNSGKYLGLLFFINRQKKSIFAYLKDRI